MGPLCPISPKIGALKFDYSAFDDAPAIMDPRHFSFLHICEFICRVLVILIQDALVGAVTEDVTIPDAPEADTEELVRFFLHPPSDLEKIRGSIV